MASNSIIFIVLALGPMVLFMAIPLYIYVVASIYGTGKRAEQVNNNPWWCAWLLAGLAYMIFAFVVGVDSHQLHKRDEFQQRKLRDLKIERLLEQKEHNNNPEVEHFEY